MKALRFIIMAVALLGLVSCSKIKTYTGPSVTHIVVYKEKRQMILLHNREVLEVYPFKLGFSPTGDKQIEGDGKTPEGRYFIDRKNPNSQFHLSLGISYPNNADRAEAARLGKSAGGDIFIHGTPRILARPDRDWTLGCIAVTNRQMEKIYPMIRIGTPITILP